MLLKQGYVCNLIETGCFVRFMGRLTGFAPKSKVNFVEQIFVCL